MTEEERDAHLREALRHAPDAGIGPAPALTELILREAHAKARSGAPAAKLKRRGIGLLWDWLGNPLVATGLAGVMAATIVGVMWWDRPLDEALPPRPEAAAAPSAAPASLAKKPSDPVADLMASSPVPAAPAVEAEATRSADAKKERKAEAEARAESKVPAPRRQSPEKAGEPALVQPPVPAPAAVPPPLSTPTSVPGGATPKPAPTEAAAEPRRLDEAPPAMAAAPRAPAPLPAQPAIAAEPSRGRATADAMAGSANDAAKRSAQRSTETIVVQGSGAPMAQAFRDGASSSAKSSAGASSERREAFAAPSLRNLRTIISAEPSHWTWQRSNDAAPLAMNAALQDWLSQLDAAAGNGWQPTASLPSATKQTLQLMRDGRVAHTFGLSDTGITWQTGDGVRKSSAPGADLQPALERIAP